MYDPQTMLVEQRIQALRQEAEQEHLAHQLRHIRRKAHVPASRSVTRAVGLQLIAWGEQLQGSSAEPRRRTVTTSS